MNPENSCSTITNTSPLPHCQQRTPSGRRCRMAVSDPDSGLCAKHAALLQKDLDQADLSASLIGDIQEFRSAADINHSLGELYKLQAVTKSLPAAPPSWPTPRIFSSVPSPPSNTNPIPRPASTSASSSTCPAPTVTGPNPNLLPQVTMPLLVTPTCLGSRQTPRLQAPRSPHEHRHEHLSRKSRGKRRRSVRFGGTANPGCALPQVTRHQSRLRLSPFNFQL